MELPAFRDNYRSHLQGQMKDSYRHFGTTYRSHLQGSTEGVADVSGQPIGPIFRDQLKDSYRRFGTTYRSHLQGSTEDGTDRLSQNASKKLPLHAM